MATPFGNDAWVEELSEKLNTSKSYQQAAKKWEGDLTLIVEKEGSMPSDLYIYLDLWHGECRSASSNTDPVSSEFTISGPLSVWKPVVDGKLDPIKALMGRKLKVQGNMMKIMKAPKAAIELVNCAKSIETEWPN